MRVLVVVILTNHKINRVDLFYLYFQGVIKGKLYISINYDLKNVCRV